MKSKKMTWIILAVLVIVTACAAITHLSEREQVRMGFLQVEYGDKKILVDLSSLATTAVQGTILNGKGDEIAVDGQGVLLSDLLFDLGIEVSEEVTAIADDEYSATVSAEELGEGRVYVLCEGERGRLVVFGDANSKRNVYGLIRLVVK